MLSLSVLTTSGYTSTFFFGRRLIIIACLIEVLQIFLRLFCNNIDTYGALQSRKKVSFQRHLYFFPYFKRLH